MDRRAQLARLLRYMLIVSALALTYILFDYSIDFRPSNIHSSYHFTIKSIPYDKVQLLQQDNLTIVLIKRSKTTIELLEKAVSGLQDPRSDNSVQPEFANNSLRSRHEQYYVSYANGTDFGCIVRQDRPLSLSETCGAARYDFAGRALIGKNNFQNLAIPVYNFSENFETLTIKP